MKTNDNEKFDMELTYINSFSTTIERYTRLQLDKFHNMS